MESNQLYFDTLKSQTAFVRYRMTAIGSLHHSIELQASEIIFCTQKRCLIGNCNVDNLLP
jgi:hypothetical protein